MIVQTLPSRASPSPRGGPQGCTAHLVEMPRSANAAASLAERIRDLLCAGERDRMATIRSAQAAWEYACSHAALRIVVGRHVGVAPGAVDVAEPGRAFVAPRLRAMHALRLQDDIHLSLSRSAPYAAIAIGRDTRVGIDVERTARAQTAFDSRNLFMNRDELLQSQGLPMLEARHHALRIWCMKEAALKATGKGLSVDPRRLSLLPRGARRTEFVAAFDGGQPSLAVHVLSSHPGSTAILALAHDLPAATPVVLHHRLDALLA